MTVSPRRQEPGLASDGKPFPAVTLYLALGLPVCLAGILGLAVNPFPIDGWYWTKDMIFRRDLVAGAAYTPVAAPAYVFAVAGLAARVMGVGLDQEFRIAAALLGVLQFLSCGFVLFSCREIGRPRIGLVVSLGTLLFAQSLYMTQAFWSEGVVNPLMAAATYGTVRLYSRPPATTRATVLASVLAGLCVGLMTITRVIPGVFLFALFLIAWYRLARPLAMLYGGVAFGVVLAIVVGQMAANEYRFGKFVLSDSGWLHLWNAESPISDAVLAESKQYRYLKSLVADVQGKHWWEVCHALRSKSVVNCPLDDMKQAAISGAFHHPWKVIAHGYGKFRRTVGEPPARFGLWGPPGSDAAGVRFLPPFAPQIRGFARFLDIVCAYIQKGYSTIVFYAVLLSLYSTLTPALRVLGLASTDGLAHEGAASESFKQHPLLAGALLVVFLASMFVTAVIEAQDVYARANAIYLPLLAVLFCYASGLTWDLLRKGNPIKIGTSPAPSVT